jgi:hypothetical protein
MKSKFTFWVVLLLIVFVGLCVITVQALWDYFPLAIDDVQFRDVFLGGFVSAALLFIFGDIKNKMLLVTISASQIEHRNLLFMSKTFDIKNISGYVTCQVFSRGGSYEFIYLVINNQKVVSVSEFYHRNFTELKSGISTSLDCLGEVKHSTLQDIRDIFKN